MRPKAKGLAKHGCPPVWLDEIDPAGVNFYVRTGHTAGLFRTVLVARQELPSCKLMEFPAAANSKCTQPSVMGYAAQGRNGLVL